MPGVKVERLEKWEPGWILEDCKRITDTANRSAADVETFNVHYEDCSSPWILCRHKNSPDPLGHFIYNFGRIPVRARSHIKGAISLPDTQQTHAYNDADFLALFQLQDAFHHVWSNLSVFIHETGHSLDGHAFNPDGHLPSSANWHYQYEQDLAVPDSYAASDWKENVVQNTVIAAYDLNVPGGFPSIELGWKRIEHQVSTLKKAQKEAGDVLIPGGMCTYRIPNSQPVWIGSKTKQGPSRRAALTEMPNVDLAQGLAVIVPQVVVNSKESCKH